MKISMIVAYGNNKQLGLDNKLLWHIPADLKNFKDLTDGHHLIMGRKTYDSIFSYIKKPLPNRTSLVLSRGPVNDAFDSVHKISSIDDAIDIAEAAGDDELIIIGGASIYKKHFEDIDRLYLSEVDYSGPADCFFEGEIDDSFSLDSKTAFASINGAPAWSFSIYNKITF